MTSPPSSRTAIMNVDRVRSDGFSNSSATCCPASGVACGRPACAPPSSTPRGRDTSRARPASGRAPRGTASCASTTPAAWRRAGSCSILRVDPHVFRAEVARPHPRRAGAARAEVDAHRTRRVLPGARDACGARSSNGRPSGEQLDVADPHARAIENESPRRRVRRPRRGGPSSDRRRESRSSRAASSRSRAPPACASASIAPPVTSIVTSLVAPSPPRTMPSASGSQTWRSASTRTGKLGVARAPRRWRPLASANTQSLVEHSPSTVIALNVSSVTAASARCSSAGATCASVVTTASMVAIIGSIMPEPLAMPPTRNRPPAVVTSTAASFGKRIGRHDGARGERAAVAAQAPSTPSRSRPRPWRDRA